MSEGTGVLWVVEEKRGDGWVPLVSHATRFRDVGQRTLDEFFNDANHWRLQAYDRRDARREGE